MNRLTSFASVLTFVLAAAAPGCDSKSDSDGDPGRDPGRSDEKTPVTRAEADEISATTASLVSSNNGDGGDVRAMNDAVLLVEGKAPNGMALTSEGSFQLERAGLRYSYKVTCVDAAGAGVACGPDADGGTLTVNWDGRYDGDVIDGSAKRVGEWTLRGVRGNNPVLSGGGSFDLSIDYRSPDGQQQASYDFGFEAKYEDVRFDRALGRPVAGRIRYEVDAKRTASGPQREANAEFEATAVVTFTASGASLNVGGSYDYDLDLKTGQAKSKSAAN